MQKVSEYVMTAEAAEILGVSQNTLRAWAKQGKSGHVNPANGYRSPMWQTWSSFSTRCR